MADLSIQISPAESVKVQDGNHGTTGDLGILQLFGVLHVQDTVTAELVLPPLVPSPQPAESLKLSETLPAQPQLDPIQPTVLTETVKVADQFLTNDLSVSLTESIRVLDFVYGASRIGGDLSAGLLELVKLKDGNQATVGEQGITQLLGVVHVVDQAPQLRFNPDDIGLTTDVLHVQDTVTAILDLSRALADEVLHVVDQAPQRSGLDGDLTASVSEALKVADTETAQLTPLELQITQESVKVADTATAQLTPLQPAGGILTETVKVQDQGPTVTGPTITVAVTDAGLYYAPFTTYSDGAGALTSNNVHGSSTYVLSNNPGWYVKTRFSGTSIALLVDASNFNANGDVEIGYSIDGAAITLYDIQIADTQIVLGSGLANTTHTLRVDLVKVGPTTTDRWNTPQAALKLTGIVIDSGATLSAPTINTPSMVIYGDSILEGRANLSASDSDSTKAFGRLIANAWAAEYGQIGFTSQGVQWPGQGNVPVASGSWDLYYAAHSRLVSGAFAPQPNVILLCWGQNHPQAGDDTTLASIISSMRTAAPTAYIVVVVPWTANDAANLASAVTIANDPKCVLVNTGSTTYDNTDGVHLSVAGDIAYANDVLARLPLGPNDLGILTDSLKVSDGPATGQLTPLQLAGGALSETLHVVDGPPTAQQALTGQATETLHVVDGPATAQLTPLQPTAALTDALRVADTIIGAQLTVLEATPATESVRVSDIQPAQPQLNPLQVSVADELLHVTDQVTSSQALTVSLTETVKITDTPTLDAGMVVSAAEAVRVSDGVTAELSAIGVSLTETLRLSDVLIQVPGTASIIVRVPTWQIVVQVELDE